MIFLVDAVGRISVAGPKFLRECKDSALLLLLLEATWCLSFDQACGIARERRARYPRER